MSFQLWALEFGPFIALNILFVVAALTARVAGKQWLIAFAGCRVMNLGATLLANRESYFPDLPWSIVASLTLFYGYFCLGMFLVSLWADKRMRSISVNELFRLSGRLPRSIFWMTFLLLLYAGGNIAITMENLPYHQKAPGNGTLNFWPAWIAASLPIPVLVWVTLSIHVKRLHDIGRSGWLSLLIFVPGVGAVATAIIGSLPGSDGENVHGPSYGHPHVEDPWQPTKDNQTLSA
ncbi:DUF805 domain-containing protein [Verrucomicrobium spinosum]|nr:DUF805 domain-containing protein [Verrucomicrobium spinosum]